MADGWWNQDYAYNQDDNRQTGTAPELMDSNTVYSPPGEAAPIDQYNYTPDPSSPGGYQTHAPGEIAPLNQPNFSNTTGQYPNSNEMANSMANSMDLTPTVDAQGNAQFMQDFLAQNGGFESMSPEDQAIWTGTYGDQAPQIWQQQAYQNWQTGQQQPAAGGYQQYPFIGNYPASQGGQTVAPSTWAQYNNLAQSDINGAYDPTTGRHPGWGTIGAGTAGIQYGYGVPGFGQDLMQIRPEYLAYLANPNLAPGYIPGSGTYNQYRLDQPGLFGLVNGVPSNLRYGLGGTGDPTTGLEPQTPDEWVQGGPLFTNKRYSNWGQGDQAGTGLDYIATLFLRPDTPSGINTAAWSAPQQFWQGLGAQIANGQIAPTNRGWAAMAAHGITPQSLGPAAVQQAQSVGVGAGGQGATGSSGGQGPMGAGTEAFNYQASYLDYLTARMKNLEIPGMNQLDQREHDKLAFEQAKQKWLEQYQASQAAEAQRQFNALQGIREAQTTGMFNGQQTLAAKAQEQQTAMQYLQLLGQLRGPGDIFQYLKVLNGTPGGIRDVVNAAAGAYRMPTTGGGAQVNGYSNGTDISTLLNQLNNPNYGAEAQNLNLPLPNQINALALQRMTPSQQQSLLAAYESAGYNPNDVLSIFRNSMPQYASQGNTGRVALFGR